MADTAFAPDTPSATDALPKAGVTDKIADAKRSEVASTDKIYGDIDKTLSTSLPKIEQLSKNAGVEAEKMKPWNEEQESAKHRTDPITAFGSLGSVVGILASAFTHAPMENALNASAAAMNAIRAGDDKEYERAYKAHESNLKMYLERHKIEHETYQDAVSLLNTNLQAAQIKLKMAATRFGDQKILAMLEAGMDKDVVDVINAKQSMALKLAEQLPNIEMANAQMSRLFALGYDPKNAQSEKSQQALVQFQKEQADLKRQEHSYSANPAKVVLDRYIAEHPEASAEEIGAFLKENTGKASGRVPKPEEEAVRAKAEELMKKNPEMSKADAIEQAQREYKLHTATPSGNRIDDIRSREAKIDNMEDTIDKIDAALVKHKAITGIGGKITRAGEAIGNILGSNQTDRAQFRRWVLEMQEWGMSVLNDRNGRPISSEAEKIEGIFAGLAAGDTNANTLRDYDEIRPLLRKIKQQLRERRGAADTKPNAPPAKANSWDAYPEVK